MAGPSGGPVDTRCQSPQKAGMAWETPPDGWFSSRPSEERLMPRGRGTVPSMPGTARRKSRGHRGQGQTTPPVFFSPARFGLIAKNQRGDRGPLHRVRDRQTRFSLKRLCCRVSGRPQFIAGKRLAASRAVSVLRRAESFRDERTTFGPCSERMSPQAGGEFPWGGVAPVDGSAGRLR